MMTAMYASQWSDHLPMGDTDGATWLCDEALPGKGTWMGRLEAIQHDMKGAQIGVDFKKYFYCPSNAFQDVAKLWPLGEWGYAVFNDRGAEAKGMPALPERADWPLTYAKVMNGEPFAAVRELALDIIVSDSDKPVGANFGNVVREGAVSWTYTSSHLGTGAAAGQSVGANVLCFDGHVEWRRFEVEKAVAVRQGRSAEAFMWIPDP